MLGPFVVAHAGHWAAYLVPALIVLAAVIVATVRERRRDRGDEPGNDGSG